MLISGSLRAGSSNAAALRTLQTLAPTVVGTDFFEGLAALPHFNPDDDTEEKTPHSAVCNLRKRLAKADGVLLSTPEYAGALPGAFKNLLEWTVGSGSLYRKSVAWLNVAGPASPSGAADAHASLHKVLTYTGARVIEEACVRIPLSHQDVGADGLLRGSHLTGQFTEALRTFLTALEAQR